MTNEARHDDTMTICVAVQHGFVQPGGLAQVNQEIQRLWSGP
jgi:hypothetical protein